MFVVTYPKCGTTWTQEMVWQILHDFDTESAAAKESLMTRSPFLEMQALTDPDAPDGASKAKLDEADYEIVPYAVLRDGMVGATNTAPPGQEPIWVSGRLFMSHLLIALESRIYTDVALRLRGEQPLGSPSEPPRD